MQNIIIQDMPHSSQKGESPVEHIFKKKKSQIVVLKKKNQTSLHDTSLL